MALNIPRLGDKTAKQLMYEPQLIYDVYQYSQLSDSSIKVRQDLYDRLYSVVKDATANSILENLDKIGNLKYVLDNNKLNIIFYEKPKELKYVAITGSLNSMKRKDFEKYIKNFNYELSSNLKKCEYLITNDVNSGSAKNKQAKELGIEIINEENFLKKLNKI